MAVQPSGPLLVSRVAATPNAHAAWDEPPVDVKSCRARFCKRLTSVIRDSLGDVTLSVLTKYTSVLVSFFVVDTAAVNTWTAVSVVSLFLLSVLSNIESELVKLNDKIAAPLQRKRSFENLMRRGVILAFYRLIYVMTCLTTANTELIEMRLQWASLALTPVTWLLVFLLTQVLLGRAGKRARIAQLAILNLDAASELFLVLSFYPAITSTVTVARTMFRVRQGHVD
jgi:hypothetical protein